jgi:hypothetical protein
MFTKDAVRVSPGVGAVSIGPQAIEESFKAQFTLGFGRIDRGSIRSHRLDRMQPSRLASIKFPARGRMAR